MPHHTFLLEHVPTPVGHMLIATDADGFLRALDWQDYEARMHKLLRLHYGANSVTLEPLRTPSAIYRSLEAYVKTAGTPFQREVWAALRTIPAGKTVSYGELAEQLGRPKSVRAVGLANGSNPVGVVVPCHRVIGADASLTGYGGGLERKHWLLQHEGAELTKRTQRKLRVRES
jgi:methylated-DNA-[protein]-cysteine S-methyltransferase